MPEPTLARPQAAPTPAPRATAPDPVPAVIRVAAPDARGGFVPGALRSPWAPWALVAAAFALRLAALVALGDPLGIHGVTAGGSVEWNWGYEQASIAQALAAGEGFADPFRQGTGPTAWVAPAYPLLLGGLIAAFGGITPGVAWSLALLQALFGALTCHALFRLGRGLHSAAAGLVAAALWALHPMAIHLAVGLVWDSSLVALALTWFLASMVERGPGAPPRALVLLGVGYGLALLTNPAPLALAPVVALHFLRPRLRGRGAGRPLLRPGGLRAAATVLGVGLVTVSPWLVRNAVQLGSPALRTNLGVELLIGNNDGAFGPFNARLHPSWDDAEGERFRELGEVQYAHEAGARAVQWIRAHPGRFARLSLQRFQLFWLGPDPRAPLMLGTGFVQERDPMAWIKWICHAGLAVLALAGLATWRGRPGSATVLVGAALLFPLVYYVTHVFERYRFPIEPLLTLAAAVFLMRLVLGPERVAALASDHEDGVHVGDEQLP